MANLHLLMRKISQMPVTFTRYVWRWLWKFHKLWKKGMVITSDKSNAL